MSIKEKSTALKAQVQEQLGDAFGILTRDIDHSRAAGTVNDALKAGQVAPAFSLPDESIINPLNDCD